MSQRLNCRTYHAAGPNFIWHIDGNDKLKPYGFAIHGCIDGYSRYLIWLCVYITNKDPTLIGGYFHDAINEMGGCPKLVRFDAGTENVMVKEMQETMMGNGRNGSNKSWIEGTSTLNQRIEAFWAHLRKQCLEYWICVFHDLKEVGNYTGDFIDTNLLQFCCMGLIQVG